MRWLIILMALATSAVAEDGHGAYFVKADRTNVRLCPAITCPTANSFDRGQAVQVFEIKQGWGRITKYYDASAERDEFPQITAETVANWVRIDLLSRTRPADDASAKFDSALIDTRIDGIPEKPAYGLSATDIAILRKYAVKLLQDGQCSAIDDGDKSLSKAGQYYVHCRGEPSNRFFSAAEIN